RQAVDHARTLSRHHVITLVGPPRPPLVVGDRVRLRQVVDNLLANAVKYAPDGGPIVVRLTVVATLPVGDGGGITGGAAAPAPQGRSDPPSWVLRRVADTGLGIPPADVPHVFERYWRAGGATRLIRGTGLGLYTCRAIVAAHGGHVWVERTAVAAELHTGP